MLLAHPAVMQAVTFAFLDERVGEEVGAAVVLRPGMEASERELQEFASARVADFKVPRVVVVLDEIPKGPTGKVQRLGLAERLGVGGEERAAVAFVEPRTQTERALAALWSEILRVPQVSARDDFFALGGDSMLAAELVARLRESHGPPDLPLTTLVWAPTLEQLAAELDGHAERRPDGLVVPIQTRGTRPPLFFVHALDGEVVRFPALARRLGADQPLYGVRARGLDGREAPHSSLDEMVSDYVTATRAVQPHGPYFLGGICLGAPIAIEMAKRLQADGEEVEPPDADRSARAGAPRQDLESPLATPPRGRKDPKRRLQLEPRAAVFASARSGAPSPAIAAPRACREHGVSCPARRSTERFRRHPQPVAGALRVHG